MAVQTANMLFQNIKNNVFSDVPANFKDTFPLFFTEVFDYYNLRNILLQQEEGKQQKL